MVAIQINTRSLFFSGASSKRVPIDQLALKAINRVLSPSFSKRLMKFVDNFKKRNHNLKRGRTNLKRGLEVLSGRTMIWLQEVMIWKTWKKIGKRYFNGNVTLMAGKQ
jgi:hypothetical protein